VSRSRLLLAALGLALVLAGCAGRRAATPPPPPSPEPPVAVAPTPPDVDSLPRVPGVVTAPWDTAARSRDVRRAHVYPHGESELGRRLVASLPDPGGLTPAEGPPANSTTPAPGAPVPAPAPAPAPLPGTGCWEAQLVVTSDIARAERVRSEAAALLGVSVRVASEAGMHRVRAGGCLDAGAALRLVDRARAEGWPEAFRTEASR